MPFDLIWKFGNWIQAVQLKVLDTKWQIVLLFKYLDEVYGNIFGNIHYLKLMDTGIFERELLMKSILL